MLNPSYLNSVFIEVFGLKAPKTITLDQRNNTIFIGEGQGEVFGGDFSVTEDEITVLGPVPHKEPGYKIRTNNGAVVAEEFTEEGVVKQLCSLIAQQLYVSIPVTSKSIKVVDGGRDYLCLVKRVQDGRIQIDIPFGVRVERHDARKLADAITKVSE